MDEINSDAESEPETPDGNYSILAIIAIEGKSNKKYKYISLVKKHLRLSKESQWIKFGDGEYT